MGVDSGYGVPKPKKPASAKPKVKPISPDNLNEKFRNKEWRLKRYERTDKGIWTLRAGQSSGRLPQRVTRVGSLTRPGQSGGYMNTVSGAQSELGKGKNRRYVAYTGNQTKK